MSSVAIIDPVVHPGWDKFVSEHPYGWLCHLSGWKATLEENFSHMKAHYLALLRDDSSIEAALPLFEVKSRVTGNRLVSLPFATLCDPLVETRDQMKMLLTGLLQLERRLHVSYIELRTYAAYPLVWDDRFAATNFYKHHYLPLVGGPEELRKGFHRSCTRQQIAKAERSSLELKMGEKESDVRDFYRLYSMTRKRLGLPAQPYRFFLSLWQFFFGTGNVQLFLALYDNQPVATLFVFSFGRRMSVEALGWDQSYKVFSPNHYLFWEAIKRACADGREVFDFGRTSPAQKGLMDFKRHWGTTVADLPFFFYPHQYRFEASGREQSSVYRFMQLLCRFAPEPAFQLIGQFCYRHLG